MAKKAAVPNREFDAEAFGVAFDAWIVKAGNRERLSAAMQPALREARRIKHSLEVQPQRMAEVVKF